MAPSERQIAGNALIDLIKFIKNYEKEVRALPLGAEARGLVAERVVVAQWYSLAAFHDILGALDRAVLRGNEQRTLEMGAAGGAAMRGLQHAYVVEREPLNSVLAMRHAWRAHYNFGALSAEATGDATVTFTVTGYPDMPMSHGLLTAGWGLAAARVAGSPAARVEVLERPWQGAKQYVYKVHV
jgi:hypothetical protein